MTFSEGDFRKSSFSDPDRECVAVARRGELVEIRDTKEFGSGVRVSAERFDLFLRSL